MNQFARSCLIAAALTAASTSGAQPPKRLPPVAFTLGMLLTFVDTAEAYRTLCAKHVTPADLQTYIGAWFERNQGLITQVLEAGSKQHWYSADRKPEEVWRQMREQGPANFRAQVAEAIADHPKAMCIDGMRPYRDGSYELEYYPFHLKALGITSPAK